jgi:hypothetical protein
MNAVASLAGPMVAMLVLAGCAGTPNTVDAAPTPPARVEVPHDTQTGDGGSTAVPAAPDEKTRPSTPFAMDGRITSRACAALVVVYGCEYVVGENFFILEFEGEAVRVSGNLTWIALPSTYGVDVTLLKDTPYGWVRAGKTPHSGGGANVFDWNATGLGRLALEVNSLEGVGLPALGVSGGVPFQFHLEGVVASRV